MRKANIAFLIALLLVGLLICGCDRRLDSKKMPLQKLMNDWLKSE